ncbi:MAG: L-fucose/L-arabinose isomerase family protein [Gemmatimonadetes bacterium]|jgi:L-arabinose isomerase|nr:L-fucose/L-arabinose isomerase family protein [Gemmatimonadota bacterium]MBT6146732.1 L-fucose/L-arabinose isomerase family protein [Gemmatimonadota bacterium]MBT7863100.1 L-fucose/L-arabinose isomerase family protein [Gemmatimonadota bacterium]
MRSTPQQPGPAQRRGERTPARVGVFGIGLAAYWDQFEGLKDRLEGYQSDVESRLASCGVQVISAGLVDTAPGARQAAQLFAREAVDLIICYVATYATSSQVLPVVQGRRVPVLVLNLQPVDRLDYATVDTGEWLANCCACCVPELSNAFARADVDFNVVSGMLYDDEGPAWQRIRDWCHAANAVQTVRGARIGFLGHTYPGMLDMYSDFAMHHGQLGLHVEVLEMCDLQTRVHEATEEEIDTKIEEIRSIFDVLTGVDEQTLRWSARVAVGLDRLVRDFDLSGLAYYYRGLDGNEYEALGAGLIVGNSLLTARGIPCAGEGDLKTCVAMLMMDALEAGGSYTEFYAMDFVDDFLLMGHDGPGHVAISDERPQLRQLEVFHGKRGAGVSVEFKVANGPVTILGLTQTRQGNLKWVAAQGESIPGPIMQIGNTNSRLKFGLDPATFMDTWCAEGPTHHVALGTGHQIPRLRMAARLLGLELAVTG